MSVEEVSPRMSPSDWEDDKHDSPNSGESQEYLAAINDLRMDGGNVSFAARMRALRFLAGWLLRSSDPSNLLEDVRDTRGDRSTDLPSLDVYERRRVSQLVVDNILALLLADQKRRGDAFTRKMVRVELFVLLSRMLQSAALFGNDIRMAASEKLVLEGISDESKESDSKKKSAKPATSKPIKSSTAARWHEKSQKWLTSMSSTAPLPEVKELSSSQSSPALTLQTNSSDPSMAMVLLPNSAPSSDQIDDSDAIDHTTVLRTSHTPPQLYQKQFLEKSVAFSSTGSSLRNRRGLPPSISSSGVENSARDKAISNAYGDSTTPSTNPTVQSTINGRSKWAPRAAMIYSDSVTSESIVPGVDPTNFIQTDKLLGYQRPRTWFPTPALQIAPSLVDLLRGANAISRSGKESASLADAVVEQYLRMKALASFAGDLLMFDAIPTSGPAAALAAFKSENVGKGGGPIVDPSRYSHALHEALKIWKPALGAHIPRNGKARAPSFLRDGEQHTSANEEDTLLIASQAKTFHSRDVAFGGERGLLQPRHLQNYTSSALSAAKRLSESRLRRCTGSHEDYIAEKEKLNTSLKQLKEKMEHTISQQQAQLAPRYLLLSEGRAARSRRLVERIFTLYIRHRSLNMMGLAFGLWKLRIVEARSAARRPLYAKAAATQLMVTWVARKHFKYMRIWFHHWRRSVAWAIMLERTAAVVKIQTHFRKRRDCKAMIAKHLCGPYLGLFSDIYLAPKRQVQFSIPDVVRKDRRMYYFAARMIQTLFRCWRESREYFYIKKCLLLLQSLGRMWPKRKWYNYLRLTTIRCQANARRTIARRAYRRLRYAALVTQAYVRRFLAQCLRLRIFMRQVITREVHMVAVIRIQRRWRIFKAKRIHKRLILAVKMREYSALVIQRSWYRFKGAYHTFFLLAAYRAAENAELQLERLATIMGRAACARVIQRFWLVRFAHVTQEVIRVQSWYRGRVGFLTGQRMRREKWASRKLRHWAKGWVTRRHNSVRRIQAWWWRLKPMRLLRHLWYRVQRDELAEEAALSAAIFKAASRIQAIVRSIWAQKFVYRTRAAMVIQKYARIWLAERFLRAQKRESVIKQIRRWVTRTVGVAMTRILDAEKARYISHVIQLQAWIRGTIVRLTLHRVRLYATKLAKAALTIQRAYRRSKAVSAAYEEAAARRRLAANPFRYCYSFGAVADTLRDKWLNLVGYDDRDPRLGMRPSTLVYRLGLPELLDAVTTKQWPRVIDMMFVSADEIARRWTIAHYRRRAMESDNDEKYGNNTTPASNIPIRPPMNLINTLVEILAVPLRPKRPEDRRLLNRILPFHAYASPQRTYELIKSAASRNRHFTTRAVELLTDLAWRDANATRLSGRVLTLAQVLRVAGDRSYYSPLAAVEALRNGTADPQLPPTFFADEQAAALETAVSAAATLNMAIDQSMRVLRPGLVTAEINLVYQRVLAYRRRTEFHERRAQKLSRIRRMKSRSLAARAAAAAAAAASIGQPISASVGGPPLEESLNSGPVVHPFFPDKKLTEVSAVYSPDEYIDIVIRGGADSADYSLEVNRSTALALGSILRLLMKVTSGIRHCQVLWRRWMAAKESAAIQKREMLKKMHEAYVEEMAENRVYVVWEKMRRKEESAQRLRLLMEAVAQRRRAIDRVLSSLPRYYVTASVDDDGRTIFLDEKGDAFDTPPLYSVQQWKAVCAIQRVMRVRLAIIAERKRLRAIAVEEERLAMEAHFLQTCSKKALRMVNVSVELEDTNILQQKVAQRRKARKKYRRQEGLSLAPVAKSDIVVRTDLRCVGGACSVITSSMESELEPLIPTHLRMESNIAVTIGMWVVISTASLSSAVIQNIASIAHLSGSKVSLYERALILKIYGVMCDVRLVSGAIVKSIPLSSLLHIPYYRSSSVEARWQRKKLFYTAAVAREFEKSYPTFATSGVRHLYYDIYYEDGDMERCVKRDALRPTVEWMESWFSARKNALAQADLQKRRHQWIIAKSVVTSDEISNHNIEHISSEDLNPNPDEGEGVISDHLQREMSPRELQDSVDANSEDEVDTKSFSLRLRVKINVSAFPLRVGWSTVLSSLATPSVDMSGDNIQYWSMETGDSSWDPPLYGAVENYAAIRIQRLAYHRLAFIRLQRQLAASPLESIVTSAIEFGNRIAWVGHGIDGLDWRRLLVRAGACEVAEYIDTLFTAAHMSPPKWSAEEFTSFSPVELEAIMGPVSIAASLATAGSTGGVISETTSGAWAPAAILRSLRDFQVWWKRTLPSDRLRALLLVTYWKDSNDSRATILDVLNDSQALLQAKFNRVLRTHPSKTARAVELLVSATQAPIAHRQLDVFLKRYGDRPDAARENAVSALANKQTTFTWIEESKVWKLYYHSALRIAGYLALGTKLRRLTAIVRNGILSAEKAYSRYIDLQPLETLPDGTTRRLACTGPEARCATMIRESVFKIVLSWCSSASLIQSRWRTYCQRKWFLGLVGARAIAVFTIQRAIRCFLSYRRASALRAARASPWEQLWDDARGRPYYYHRIDRYAQYEEPPNGEAFRPLIRDRRTAVLLQAWPDLDENDGSALALLPQSYQGTHVMRSLPDNLVCSICSLRRIARLCGCCAADDAQAYSEQYGYQVRTGPPIAYCVPCFVSEHSRHSTRGRNLIGSALAALENHRFELPTFFLAAESNEQAESSEPISVGPAALRCCECGSLATRKCQGPFSDAVLHSLTTSLCQSPPCSWFRLLDQSNIGGENRIVTLIRQFLAAIGEARLLVLEEDFFSQAMHISRKDSSLAAARDKVSSIEPVVEAPSWVTEAANAVINDVQLAAIAAVLERSRSECDDCYCSSCYTYVHTAGRRATHVWRGFQPGAIVCGVCAHAPADTVCTDCGHSNYCSPCFKVFHHVGRKRRHISSPLLEILPPLPSTPPDIKSDEHVDETDNNSSDDSSEDSGLGAKIALPRSAPVRAFGYCEHCQRRIGYCCEQPPCKVFVCEECSTFIHPSTCIGEYSKPPVINAPRAMSAGAIPCIICGDAGDRRCLQCGDVYCGRTWGEGGGCWAQFHARGNRAAHIAEPLNTRSSTGSRAFM